MKWGLREALEMAGEVPLSDWSKYLGNLESDLARIREIEVDEEIIARNETEGPPPAPSRLVDCERCGDLFVSTCGTDYLCAFCRAHRPK